MRIKIILLNIFLFIYHSFYAQNKEEQDSLNDRNKISFATGVSYSSISLKLNIKDTQTKKIILNPNEEANIDFYMRYKFINIDFSFSPKIIYINNDKNLKGNTNYFNLGLSLFITPKLKQSLRYTKTKGFYIENSQELLPNILDANEFILLPDYTIVSLSGETNYFWHGMKQDNLSYNNITYQPQKTNWIFISGISYKYNFESLIGDFVVKGNHFQNLQDTDIYSQSLNLNFKIGGGTQQKISKNWFIIGELYPELKYFSLVKNNYSELHFGLNAFSRLGYDNKKIFFGALANINWNKNSSDIFYANNQYIFKLFLGYRFNSPKKINQIFDKYKL